MTGTRLYEALRHVLDSLTAAGARFALVGGLAVSARAEPRFTRDIDLAVAVAADAEAEALIQRLRGLEFEILALVEQEATSRLATVRLVPSLRQEAGVVVDLLFASSGIEPEIVAAATVLTIADGLELRVATTGHLIATKILSRDARRLQDQLDLDALLQVATEGDLEEARRALGLIASRGFDRKKALIDELEHLIDDTAR